MVFICQNCNKNFKQESKLNYHNEHNVCLKKKFACNFCNKSFKTKNSLYSHKSANCKNKNLQIDNEIQQNNNEPNCDTIELFNMIKIMQKEMQELKNIIKNTQIKI